MGSASLACWLVVYAPQVWENYQLQSGEGLSVAFIVLWLLGDLTGLLGSILAGLIPSVIILATYVSLLFLISRLISGAEEEAIYLNRASDCCGCSGVLD